MNLVADLFDNDASDDRLALLTQHRNFTYGELKRAVYAVADFFRSQGLMAGDRVVLVAESSFFWVASYLGTILAGGVSVPLPPSVDQETCRDILAQVQCRWAAVERRVLRKHHDCFVCCQGGIVDERPFEALQGDGVFDLFGDIVDRCGFSWSGAPEGVKCSSSLASIMFTSGSTGRPRGVMVSHRNIQVNTLDIIASLGLTGDDRTMAVLPFFYCFGTSVLHTHLKVGGSLVIDNRFLFPDKVLERMRETCCTGFAGVPSTYQILLRNSSLKRMTFPHLRKLQQAGGKLSEGFVEELQAALPDAQVYIMYGQTEATARLSCLPPQMLAHKPGSVGKGLSGVTLSVVDEAGRSVAVGEIGEVTAQGESVCLGYWGDPLGTEQSFRAGRLYTGDLARVDEDGYVFIVDRAADFLKCGGIRVSCKDVEERVLAFEGMVETAVIGCPDPVLGEAVHLFVVHPRGTAIREDLEQFCRKKLSRSLVPRRISFLDELPKNSSGKYDKRTLKRNHGL